MTRGLGPALMSQRRAITGLGLAKTALCRQPERMMARLSPKHLIVMLLAVFLTAGFSLSAAQADVMSATMASGMAMTVDAGMGAGSAMKSDCKACLKDTGDSLKQCPPVCIAPVLAVLPQDFAMTTVLHLQQPSAEPTPFLRGRSSLPDPYPPRPSA
ncbi:hypothetical protein [Mesorhizobium sp. WSM4904]|uniref:hypothetical protein n=1 Tax=Mesorhizobium sp. WSM4904 TaxID=3038545 RepID=UPI00241856C8|nr:hypothetical protein [Mesorhizobium sp. WSM4904]WFP60649.1 hypothetical protein QAZ47_19275 [Mesorhizobium sp. WSM4904]